MFIIGIGCILVGCFSIWITKKYPSDRTTAMNADMKGYVGGFFLIVTGILMLIKYFSE